MKSNAVNKPGFLPIMEEFYTIQGEGRNSGEAAYFVRIAGCDVGCVWCDVKESWDTEDSQYQSIESIVDNVLSSGTKLCVITGGEPCMYDLTELIEKLNTNRHCLLNHNNQKFQ